MATKRTISGLSLPSHLASFDWNNPNYRTSVAACLIQGVYKLALVPESEAKHWWELSNFTLVEILNDQCNGFPYGAIFEYNNHKNYQYISVSRPPRFVIALRGTLLKPRTLFCDVRSCIRCILDTHHDSPTAKHALEATQRMVAQHSNTPIWLAGHSLGAARALLVGKTMARQGIFLEAYIFNPPISAFPLEQLITGERLKNQIRIAKCLFKASVARIFKDLQVQQDDVNLASWRPYIYVNREDPICSEYIGYFKNKTVMSRIGKEEAERIATKTPLRSLLFETETLHLLPSAYLIVNMKGKQGFDKDHGVEQWWDASFEGECVLYPEPNLRE